MNSQLGTGSVWNPRTWHWETRSYNAWAEALLRRKLLAVSATGDGVPLAVRVTSIERLSADATVNLRKGRKFVSFDVSFVVKWQGFAPSGVVDRVTNGELAVSDLMADDVASDFQLRLSFAGSTAFDTTCRDLMAGKGAAAVRAAVRAFAAELTAHDDALEAAATAATAQVPSPAAPAAAPASVPAACEGSGPATAVARRVEAAAPPRPHAADEADAGGDGLERDVARLAIGAAMRSGHAVTSGVAVKTPPADATPVPGEPSEPSRTVPGEHSRTVHREREPSAPALREPSIRAAVVAPAVTATTVMAAAATSVPAAATGAEAPAGVGPVGRAGAVTGGRSGDGGGGGSEWNAGSFHWEERPLTAWATQRLSELLRGVDIDIPGGSVRIVDVELKGDASQSLRRGRRLVFFEFTVTAKWEGELIDAQSGAVLGTGDGDLIVPDIDQDSGAAGYELRITAADDGGAMDARLAAMFKQHGAGFVRARLAQFVEDLKAR